ncbi:MAG: ATP synthase F0 subunit B [Acidobacteriota bacterium]|nr:ATP synthase F0 subunit B [Acidobacteriota bacterium]
MKKFIAILMLAGALSVCPLMAEESAGKPAEQSQIWKWLNFAMLAGVLGWLISKNLGPVLITRSAQIQGGLAAGEKARAEADARAAAVQAKLADLGQVVAQMKTSAREERDREADRIRRDTQTELARIQRQADQDIESAGKLALLEVKREAARLAINLAERKVRARMSPDIQAALFQNFIGEMASGAARVQGN